MARARRREMASPSPVPPCRRRTAASACSNSKNRNGSASAAMPMPVSSTVMAMRTSSDSGAPSPAPLVARATVTSTPPAVGELDGVADQVGEDLAQPNLVAQQRRRHVRVDAPRRCRCPSRRPSAPAARPTPCTHSSTASGAVFSCSLSASILEKSRISSISVEQRARRSLDGLGVGLLLLGRQLGVAATARSCRECRSSACGSRGSCGQEARLGAVGRLRLRAGLAQLSLGSPPLGDVAAEALHLRHGSVGRRARHAPPTRTSAARARSRSAARSAAGAARGPAPAVLTVSPASTLGANTRPSTSRARRPNTRQKAWLTKVRRPSASRRRITSAWLSSRSR